MPFQFCCPQGHVLQGDPSQVGQVFHCPMCGSSFLVPPPETAPAPAGGYFQGAGTWPAANAPAQTFPAQGGMPGMMAPQTMPQMPVYPMPSGPAPTQPAQQPRETAPQGETDRPQFDLGFDPSTKHSLPFEIGGQSPEETAPFSSAGPTAPSFAVPSHADGSPPAAEFPVPSMPATFQPVIDGPDFLQAAPKDADVPEFLKTVPGGTSESDADAPKILHIRCPAGHLVTANSDLLGKTGRCPACKQTFEIRYENSVEFKRRKAKLMHREEITTGRAWVAWAFLGAFLVFVAIIAVLLAMSR